MTLSLDSNTRVRFLKSWDLRPHTMQGVLQRSLQIHHTYSHPWRWEWRRRGWDVLGGFVCYTIYCSRYSDFALYSNFTQYVGRVYRVVQWLHSIGWIGLSYHTIPYLYLAMSCWKGWIMLSVGIWRGAATHLLWPPTVFGFATDEKLISARSQEKQMRSRALGFVLVENLFNGSGNSVTNGLH